MVAESNSENGCKSTTNTPTEKIRVKAMKKKEILQKYTGEQGMECNRTKCSDTSIPVDAKTESR